MSYCTSRFRTVRRPAVEVKVGRVGVGGRNPIRLQSMTTSDTQDVAATVRQAVALAEVGCEIVRVTAPNVAAARCLREIRSQFTEAGFGHVPLVADIHFLPGAAMEAVEHVEKVRVNPGNYADKKRFAVREYSDADYERELQRLHEAFTPLVLRAKALGRSLRIGTNHGSLSDRVMNRHGDTPLGMVESALEFVRICESHGFHEVILSMKASNPKVMIQAYRLLVVRMDAAHRAYPLHLGVTEAGDGEDGRIKSAIGIGSLLLDGLGDTIRVSLTEDSVYEIPVARALADKAMAQWAMANVPPSILNAQTPASVAGDAGRARLKVERPESANVDSVDPFQYARRATTTLTLAGNCTVGPEQPPRVIVRIAAKDLPDFKSQISTPKYADTPAEGLLLNVTSVAEIAALPDPGPSFYVLELSGISLGDLGAHPACLRAGTVLLPHAIAGPGALGDWLRFAREHSLIIAADVTPADFAHLETDLRRLGDANLIITLTIPDQTAGHPPGDWRLLSEQLHQIGSRAPLWIRNTPATALGRSPDFLNRLLDASILTGALLCDGLGDFVSVETEPDPLRATTLAYNILQGAGTRSSKAEFVACPSCGRTLFDLQTTTRRIRARTGHLKGVKIAIMGCIVNGPGEMADADFGYVGGAPGKINLYVGKACVQYNLPQAEADDRLIALIREHGKWAEPVAGGVAEAAVATPPDGAVPAS